MSPNERSPEKPSGVFDRQDGVKPYLVQSIPLGSPQCFLGSFRMIDGEGFFVTSDDQRYHVLKRGQEHHPLVRHLRTATPGVTETDGGGFRLHQGFAVIRATSPSSSECWLLIDASKAAVAVRAIEEAVRCPSPSADVRAHGRFDSDDPLGAPTATTP